MTDSPSQEEKPQETIPGVTANCPFPDVEIGGVVFPGLEVENAIGRTCTVCNSKGYFWRGNKKRLCGCVQRKLSRLAAARLKEDKPENETPASAEARKATKANSDVQTATMRLELVDRVLAKREAKLLQDLQPFETRLKALDMEALIVADTIGEVQTDMNLAYGETPIETQKNQLAELDASITALESSLEEARKKRTVLSKDLDEEEKKLHEKHALLFQKKQALENDQVSVKNRLEEVKAEIKAIRDSRQKKSGRLLRARDRLRGKILRATAALEKKA